MGMTVARIQDELNFKNHLPDFMAAVNPSNFSLFQDPKAQDDFEVFMLATRTYSFLLPSCKDVELTEWADIIDTRYNSPQAVEVANLLRKFSEKYSA